MIRPIYKPRRFAVRYDVLVRDDSGNVRLGCELVTKEYATAYARGVMGRSHTTGFTAIVKRVRLERKGGDA